MQRMLVGLVLFLTAAVGGLAIVVLNMPSARGPARGAADRTVESAGADPAAVDALKRQISGFEAEIKALRNANAGLAADVALAKRLAGRRSGSGGSDGGRLGSAEPMPAASERPLGPDGSVDVTDVDVDRFVAVQKEVERRRRITSQTKNMMRRIERLAGKGEIQPLDARKMEQLDALMRSFVTQQDNLITLYVRDPPRELEALTAEQRRDRRSEEGDRVIEETRGVLHALLGEQDAQVVVEKSLRSMFGMRRNLPNRRGGGRRNG